MDDLVSMGLQLRQRAHDRCCELSREFGASEDRAPLIAFSNAFNHLTVTTEMFDSYRWKWTNQPVAAASEGEALSAENAERVIFLGRNLFLSVLSSIEYSAKECLRGSPGALSIEWGSRVYLSTILTKSHQAGWISEDTFRKMQDLLFVRNCVVHNNGVSDEDRLLFEPRGKDFQATKDAMLRGDLKLFLGYVEFTVDAFTEWSRSFLEATRR